MDIFDASHMSSKGFPQIGDWKIMASIEAFLRVLKAIRHSFENTKGVSSTKSELKGLAILEKSFMNLW